MLPTELLVSDAQMPQNFLDLISRRIIAQTVVFSYWFGVAAVRHVQTT